MARGDDAPEYSCGRAAGSLLAGCPSLFFGGYLSPFGTYILPENLVFLEQTFWLLLKTFITILLIILIRASLPRLRYDRLLKFSYLVLLPLSLINLNISILVLYFRGN